MLIKNCAVKRLGEDYWLHHTASGYKARMNAGTLAALQSMASRLEPSTFTADEKFLYEKLSPKGIAGPDTGRDADRRVPLKGKSRLESVELEFSGRCNLRCAHCFSSLSQKEMARAVLGRVFDGIDSLEPVNLVINGGEPLLNPLLPEALEQGRARNMRLVVTTNGLLVGADTAALFKRTGVAKAVISLDFFEETHDALRGAGTFARTTAGIRRLTSAGVPVFVTAMVQRDTAARLEEFRRYCQEELGVTGLRFSSVMPIGRAAGAPELQLPAPQVRQLFGKGDITASDGGDGAFARLAGERTFYCGAGISECFVSAGGKVYACHYFQNIGEPMGDLAARPLEAIYNDYPASGAAAVDFDWEKLAQCRSCASFAKCRGGCRARARLLNGGWYAPDSYSCAMYGAC